MKLLKVFLIGQKVEYEMLHWGTWSNFICSHFGTAFSEVKVRAIELTSICMSKFLLL